jgi:hypothetical protein
MAAFLRSPWASRLLFWAGGLTLIAGMIVFLVAVFGRGNAEEATPFRETPQQAQQQLQREAQPDFTRARVDPKARVVAGKFILTAVARENLAESWKLVHPSLRQGLTLAQWKTGNIPVAPYPVHSLEQARFKVDESYPNQVLLEVALIPKKGAKIRPQVFDIGLRAVGKGARRHWLVDYWMPVWSPPVPANPAQ